MINGIRKINPCRLNEGFDLKFCVSTQVQQETPEEGWRMHQPKREYSHNDKDNSVNILNDKEKKSC